MAELPKGWATDTLGNLVIVERGSSPRPIKSFLTDNEDGVNWIKIGDATKGQKLITSTAEKITKEGALKSRFVDVGDFILSNSMSFGLPYIMGISGYIHDGWFVFRLPKEISSDYFYYLLSSSFVSSQFNSLAVGGVVKNISGDLVKKAELPLPPLPEQKRIVEKLDEVLAQVDTIKARLDGIPELLKRFRQSVLASAVSGKLIALTHAKLVTIGDVTEDIRYGTSKKCDYKGGQVPVIRIPNIGDRTLNVSDLKSADFTDAEIKKLSLKEGDLLIIRSNGSLELVAKPALVEKEYEGYLFAGYLIRIRCNFDMVLPSFLLNVLCSRVVRDVVELGARSTSGVNNINSKELGALSFVLPPLEEQKEIVRLVDQYFAFADTIEAQVKKAQTRVDNLTQSILAKAFRGELVPQDPNDEPAEVLLKRISKARAEAEQLAKAAKKAGKKKA